MVWRWLFTDVNLVKVIFKVLGFFDMNFPEVHFIASGSSKVDFQGIRLLPKPYFHEVGELQSSFPAFGLSKVYF